MSLEDVEGLSDSLVEALEVVLDEDEKQKLIGYYQEHGEEGVKEVDVVELLGLERWRRVKLSRLLVTDPRLMRAKNRVMEKYPDRFDEVKEDVEKGEKIEAAVENLVFQYRNRGRDWEDIKRFALNQAAVKNEFIGVRELLEKVQDELGGELEEEISL